MQVQLPSISQRSISIAVCCYYLALSALIGTELFRVLQQSGTVIDHGYTVAQEEKKQKQLLSQLQELELESARARSLSMNTASTRSPEFVAIKDIVTLTSQAGLASR